MRPGTSGWILWGIYAAFAVFALITGANDTTFQFAGSLGALKAMTWVAWIAFLAYSVYCSFRENFVRSVKSIATMHWGRQIGIDLYLGLLVSLLIVYLYGGAMAVLIWLVPVLIYANLAILLYVAIHFDGIAATLTGA